VIGYANRTSKLAGDEEEKLRLNSALGQAYARARDTPRLKSRVYPDIEKLYAMMSMRYAIEADDSPAATHRPGGALH
jgi:hypothetical protein